MENMGMYSYMHPMGDVPKMDGTTEVGVRVIQNYAYPKLNSVNDFVSYFPVKISKMDEVADYVERNPGCFAAKNRFIELLPPLANRPTRLAAPGRGVGV